MRHILIILFTFPLFNYFYFCRVKLHSSNRQMGRHVAVVNMKGSWLSVLPTVYITAELYLTVTCIP